jgi:hypothetical protein
VIGKRRGGIQPPQGPSHYRRAALRSLGIGRTLHHLASRHLLEFRHDRIEPIPGMTAHRVRHHLRLVSAWIVEARGVNGEEVRRGRESQIDRRAAGGVRWTPCPRARRTPAIRHARVFCATLFACVAAPEADVPAPTGGGSPPKPFASKENTSGHPVAVPVLY